MTTGDTKVLLNAKVTSNPKVLLRYGMEAIYEVEVSFKRLSNKEDKFLLNYQSSLGVELKPDMYIDIEGELRSSSIQLETGKRFTKVFIFGKNISVLEYEPEKYVNKVIISNAELIRTPKLRKSYTDNSTDIADIKLRVLRRENKESILSCSCWNNNARLVVTKHQGDRISIEGMLQSYKLSSGSFRAEVAVYSISDTEV